MHVRSLPVKIALIAAATIVTVFGIGTYFLAENAGSVIDQQNAEIQNSIADSQAFDASKSIDIAAHVGEDISTVLAALKAKSITDRATLDDTLRTLLEKNTNVLRCMVGMGAETLSTVATRNSQARKATTIPAASCPIGTARAASPCAKCSSTTRRKAAPALIISSLSLRSGPSQSSPITIRSKARTC